MDITSMLLAHRPPLNVILYAGWILTIALLSGCSRDQGPERVVVTGTVTYNGKLVPEALIRFVPTQTSAVPTAGAVIADGQYRVDIRGGVPVGTHRIQIEAFRKIAPGPGNSEQLDPRASKQYLPAKYNVNTQLEINIPSGSREITKNFALTD
jgi:hypothetical protein